MVHPTQCNGSGWAAGKPGGNLGRMPTTSQKRLRGKMVNPITTGSIKGHSCEQ